MNISTHHQFRRFISLPRSIKQRNQDKRSSAPFQRVDFPVKLQMNCPRFNKRTEINGKYARFVTENGVLVTVLSAHGSVKANKFPAESLYQIWIAQFVTVTQAH